MKKDGYGNSSAEKDQPFTLNRYTAKKKDPMKAAAPSFPKDRLIRPQTLRTLKNKPLRFNSTVSFFVASVFLICNGALAKESMDRSSNKRIISPYLEKSRLPQEIISSSVTAKIYDSFTQRLQVSFDFIPIRTQSSGNSENLRASSFFKKTYKRKTHLRDKVKKTANSNKEIGAEKRGSSQKIDPNFEQKKEKKHSFAGDCYFHFDDSFLSTYPYPLESDLSFEVVLLKGYAPIEKTSFPKKSHFAEGYFKSLEWQSFSSALGKETAFLPKPSLEPLGTPFFTSETNSFRFNLVSTPFQKAYSKKVPFGKRKDASESKDKELFMTFDLPYRPYKQKKVKWKPSPFLAKESSKLSFYLDAKPLETARGLSCYGPSREKILRLDLEKKAPLFFSKKVDQATFCPLIKSPFSLVTIDVKSDPLIKISRLIEFPRKFKGRKETKLNPKPMPHPYFSKREISPRKMVQPPIKVAEDIPHIQSLAALIKRNASSLTKKNSPSTPLKESFLLQTNYCLLRASRLDALLIELPRAKEMQVDDVKKKPAPFRNLQQNFDLSYNSGRKKNFDKPLMTSFLSFKDFSEANLLIKLANSGRGLTRLQTLQKANATFESIQPEFPFFSRGFPFLKTDTISSESKEILRNYHEKTLLSLEHAPFINHDCRSSPSHSERQALNQSSRLAAAFLTEISPPSYLETISYDNEFDTSVYYSKREEGKGYLFSVKIKPSQNFQFASPNQHYVFALDGSSSIKKHRFEVFKEGIGKALSYLEEGDSFNIVVADAELIPFNKKPTPWSKRAIAKAKQFLMEQSYRGFFINYSTFDLVSKISEYLDPDKENIVILITDGCSCKSFQNHKDDFKKLTQTSQGKFSLFAATASQGNNLSMLGLLSTFNNGELMHSKTNVSFSRQLAVLVKHIESFVAKNIHINVASVNQETGIEFYPNEKNLPLLYADRPYTIYGSIDELKDFDLILQGKSGNKWINIKQTISFKHAEKATQAIKKEIALQKAYVCYDYFLKNNDPFFLTEAQNILEPYSIPAAIR